jgi:serine phosphatase RsbU (regulator of sigma subunit)
MAKAPRRGKRDRGGGKRPAKPVRPAVPPAAQPVKPVKPVQPARPKPAAVAQPVKPVKPPPARPVPPAAAPVAQPVAKPVQPVAPAAQPVAKRPAGKPAASRRGRMSEEEVGGRPRGRPARGGYSRGGMGIGGKVGLLAALMAFIAIGLTVFLPGMGGKKEDEGAEMSAFGYTAVSALAGPGASWYRGGPKQAGGLAAVEDTFKEIFGEEGAAWWDERVGWLTTPPDREANPFQQEKHEKASARFEKIVTKLDKPDTTLTGSRLVKARIAPIFNDWRQIVASQKGRYSLDAAWIREDGPGNGGRFLGGSIGDSDASVKYADSGWNEVGAGYAWIHGLLKGQEVRIFRGPVPAMKPSDRLLAYVAVSDTGKSSGGGFGIGMIMLVLGPLLVGFVAYAVASGHTKGIRNLAREIDRLGSSGDPTRELRTNSAEASAVARSVERMVSNLEVRSKHEGADLDEVVSREQAVAQEIHGTLMSRNPPRLSNYEVETLFKPGFEIGGDHFEYFAIDDDHLGIILLDTNVRGIPAALVMSAAKSYVRAAAPAVLSPAEVLKQVNRNLAGELPPGRHVTALYAVLNQSDGSATLASAGHLPLLVYRHASGKMAKVNPEGIALGLDAGPVFDRSLEEGDIPIGVGDRIVLYTDGALKIQNEGGEEFGEQRFYGAVTAEAPKNSQAFVNFVGAAIDRFHLEVPQNDDITISTVKRLR